MSLKPGLLPGLPPYVGGKTSINVYNAGGGLYDERTIDANLPMPIEDGSVMPIGAFKTLINSLLKPHAGQNFTLSNAKVEILQTHECYTAYGCNEMPEDFNDTSTVLKITFDSKVFLMLGDINKIGEAQLLKHYSEDTLKSDLVQAAHHLFNTLYYIYDVADPEYIVVPTRVESKTNHDKMKYARLVLTRSDDQVFFASDDGTHGFAVRDGKLSRIYHDILRGGEYDGSDS